jgi:type I restriction enzyme S subunit
MAGEWKKFRVGQLGSVVTGRTPPGTLPEYFGDAVPFITPTDMDGRRTVRETARSLSPEGSEILKRVIVQRGVAVSCIGWQMGKAVLIDRPAATNQQINTLVPNPNIADALFTYYALTSEREAIFRLGAGGSRTPILNKSGFEAFELNLPPLTEQKAIASVLGALDDKIELNRRMNTTLEAMARALFQSWFVDFDPVRAKLDGRRPAALDPATAALFPEDLECSKLGHIPRGWEEKTIESLCDVITSGGTPARMHKVYWEPSTVPWFKTGELMDGPLLDSEEGISEDGLANSSCKLWPAGTILFALYASPTVGRFGVLTKPGTANQAAAALVAKPAYGVPFLMGLLYEARAELQRVAVGAAQQNINQGVLKNHVVIAPPPALAIAYSERVAPWFEQRIKLAEQSRTLTTLRDTLLPKLLSGELRVPIAAEQIEARA